MKKKNIFFLYIQRKNRIRVFHEAPEMRFLPRDEQ